MSLDIVEFGLSIEEAFDLQIPDKVEEKLTTPRQLIDYISSQHPRNNEAHCLSQRAFYAILRELACKLGEPPKYLRPGTHLASVLLPENA